MTMTESALRHHYDDPAGIGELSALVPEVEATVRSWLEHSQRLPVDKAAARLAAMLNDSRGLAFTVGFVDGVIRPEDVREAARTFAQLARDVPGFLPWHLRAAVKVGARVAKPLPWVVIPAARLALRGMVGHLVADAREKQLGRTIRRLRRTAGTRLNLNLLGEAVLGEREAARRLDGTRRLLARDDVDYVSIKVSSTVAPHNPWAFDEAVAHIVSSLTPLFRQAAAASPAKFINLDMEEYRDLRLTVAVFTALLDQPEFLGLEAGIVLQAYLPDALRTMMVLQDWAAARRRRGGAGIKVRLVKGANLPMERVDARCTAGRWRRGRPSRSPTPTTSACWTTRCTPRGSRTCGSGSPGTTCSTSRSRGTWPGCARPGRGRVRDAARHGGGPGGGGEA